MFSYLRKVKEKRAPDHPPLPQEAVVPVRVGGQWVKELTELVEGEVGEAE